MAETWAEIDDGVGNVVFVNGSTKQKARACRVPRARWLHLCLQLDALSQIFENPVSRARRLLDEAMRAGLSPNTVEPFKLADGDGTWVGGVLIRIIKDETMAVGRGLQSNAYGFTVPCPFSGMEASAAQPHDDICELQGGRCLSSRSFHSLEFIHHSAGVLRELPAGAVCVRAHLLAGSFGCVGGFRTALHTHAHCALRSDARDWRRSVSTTGCVCALVCGCWHV